MSALFHHFFHLLGEALPLFLLGAAVGAALEIWLPRGWVERWLAEGKGSVLLAASAGALLPGCAMSTMPLARSLRARGVPVGTVAAFIMIAPVLSPHTVVLTATLISVPMAGARVVLAFLVACALGFVLNAAQRRRSMIFPAPAPEPSEPSHGHSAGKSCCDETPAPAGALPAWRQWLARFLGSLRELAPFLIGGLLVAAALLAFFPIEKYQAQLRGGWLAYVIVILIAIPAYVCDGGEIPLTRALLALGVGAGPAFCFMLASVGTCFPTIAMSGRIIGWRAAAIYLAAWLVLAVGGGVLVGALLPPRS
jgi:uncharacterized membrane protein YraQ (UPF0718 family)